MKIAYDIEISGSDDAYISTAEESLDSLAKAGSSIYSLLCIDIGVLVIALG